MKNFTISSTSLLSATSISYKKIRHSYDKAIKIEILHKNAQSAHLYPKNIHIKMSDYTDYL